MATGLKTEKSFKLTPRMKRLSERSKELALNGKRNLYAPDIESMVFHWSDICPGPAPATGDYTVTKDKRINIGNHHCRVDLGKPFPRESEIPSKVEGFDYTYENWAKDYKFLLDNSPAEIHPDEHIIGEFHWELNEIRMYKYPDEVLKLAKKARKLGAGGTSLAHTCPDLGIGLRLGWNGILKKIFENKEKYTKYYNKKKVSYLSAAEKTCKAIIRFIKKHSDKAYELARNEKDPERKKIYLKVAMACENISKKPPSSFMEAVQWIYLYIIVNRMHGHGNGYGRLDQLLIDFYKDDIKKGILTKQQAREYLAELFLKFGHHFGLGGRDRNLNDSTNEVSWVALEAYDMIGGYSHLGVMWHPDMDIEFYSYACDVLARHGAGCPVLINYDLMRASELRSGVSEEDAWNISYSGCQWYCTVGNEYCDQDVNSLVIVMPMQRAIDIAVKRNVGDFEELFYIFKEEFLKTAYALRDLKNKAYEVQSGVWPEMVTSMCMFGPIEKGMDITHPGAVNNEYTSTNLLGVPNVVDSLYAIKKVVFEDKRYSLKDLRDAVKNNWQNNEVMRQIMLNQEKFGNDLEGVDTVFIRVTDMIADIMDNLFNIKGSNFRASLFQFMGHAHAGPLLGATPDGRFSDEPLAHGCNPMYGRNKEGITATANSLSKCGFERFQGGSLQIELQPKASNNKSDLGRYIEDFSIAFMKSGGMQINLNIIDLEKLKRAVDHPEDPEYQDIVIKVTGYSSYFVVLDKEFRKEFIKRVNYEDI